VSSQVSRHIDRPTVAEGAPRQTLPCRRPSQVLRPMEKPRPGNSSSELDHTGQRNWTQSRQLSGATPLGII
jgi:hypothetical protein